MARPPGKLVRVADDLPAHVRPGPRVGGLTVEVEEAMKTVPAGKWACLAVDTEPGAFKSYLQSHQLKKRFEVKVGGGELWVRRRPNTAPGTVPAGAPGSLAPASASVSERTARGVSTAEFAAVYKDMSPEGGRKSAELSGDVLGISRSHAFALRNKARSEGLI